MVKVKKTECWTRDVNVHRPIKATSTELLQVTFFMFSGSAAASDGSFMLDVNARMSSAWSKLHPLSGLLCDKAIFEHFKSNAEYWTVIKKIESRCSEVDTGMQRWTLPRIARLQRVRKDTILKTLGFAPKTG